MPYPFPTATQTDAVETLLQVKKAPNIKYAECLICSYPDHVLQSVKIHIVFAGEMPQWKVPKERMPVFFPTNNIKAKEIASGISRRRMSLWIPYVDKQPFKNGEYVVVDKLEASERDELTAEGFIIKQGKT